MLAYEICDQTRNEQGMSARSGEKRLAHRGWDVCARKTPNKIIFDFIRRKWLNRDFRADSSQLQLAVNQGDGIYLQTGIHGAVSRQHQQERRLVPLRQQAEKVQCCVIAPMKILQYERSE